MKKLLLAMLLIASPVMAENIIDRIDGFEGIAAIYASQVLDCKYAVIEGSITTKKKCTTAASYRTIITKIKDSYTWEDRFDIWKIKAVSDKFRSANQTIEKSDELFDEALALSALKKKF